MTNNPQRTQRMLTIRQLAERYGVCTKTISRWIKNEGLDVHRIGRTVRIADEDAHAFMAARRG
jgi:excisionase family DNA binding protein